MIPKFRAYLKETETLAEVIHISFENKVLKVRHWEYGESTWLDFNEVELLQFTGLKDKDGVEIYQGDIVKGQITLAYKRTGVIKFDTDSFCFVEFRKEGMVTVFEENPDRMIIYNGFDGFEVIGNIYENPELLEGATNASK